MCLEDSPAWWGIAPEQLRVEDEIRSRHSVQFELVCEYKLRVVEASVLFRVSDISVEERAHVSPNVAGGHEVEELALVATIECIKYVVDVASDKCAEGDERRSEVFPPGTY